MKSVSFCFSKCLNRNYLHHSNLEMIWTEGIWNGNRYNIDVVS